MCSSVWARHTIRKPVVKVTGEDPRQSGTQGVADTQLSLMRSCSYLSRVSCCSRGWKSLDERHQSKHRGTETYPVWWGEWGMQDGVWAQEGRKKEHVLTGDEARGRQQRCPSGCLGRGTHFKNVPVLVVLHHGSFPGGSEYSQ